ncbi:MAG: hypothetical protein ACI94Y_002422 [Maribacter sp.]|jgi:hypothetical protein
MKTKRFFVLHFNVKHGSIPEKHDRLLKEGEKVRWYKVGSSLISKGVFVVLSLILGLLIVTFIISAILSRYFGLASATAFFSFVFFGVNYYYYSLSNIHFTITNALLEIPILSLNSIFFIYYTKKYMK